MKNNGTEYKYFTNFAVGDTKITYNDNIKEAYARALYLFYRAINNYAWINGLIIDFDKSRIKWRYVRLWNWAICVRVYGRIAFRRNWVVWLKWWFNGMNPWFGVNQMKKF